jgi:hypothetical protein
MHLKSTFLAAIAIVATTLSLSVVMPLLVAERVAGWGEEGALQLWAGSLAVLIAVAFALARKVQSREGAGRVTPEKQGQAWLQNHLMECTSAVDAVGHESAMPHLLSRERDRHRLMAE